MLRFLLSEKQVADNEIVLVPSQKQAVDTGQINYSVLSVVRECWLWNTLSKSVDLSGLRPSTEP